MIPYKLEQELKDAGFPQNLGLEAIAVDYDMPPRVPTLEELIEACGEIFWYLSKATNPEHDEYRWYALATGQNIVECSYGKTPIEAVATLWLRLNKK